MPTYRLIIEYEGTRYRGWQEQENARTVAGELRRAISRVAGPLRELTAAGRTDAGVHACAQVAHARLVRPVDTRTARRKVNDLLPADIEVLALDLAPDSFHARHDATARSYVYQVSRRRTAFAKPFVWWVKRELDVALLKSAWSILPGRHDFARFCEQPASHPSTVVVVERAEVGEAGDLLLLRIVSSHFLWKMVRRLVGTAVEVAAGDLPLDLFGHLVAGYELPGTTAGPAAWTAPPSGLFLERVLYPSGPPLPELAAITPVPPVPARSEWSEFRTASRAETGSAREKRHRAGTARGSDGRPAGSSPRREDAAPRSSGRGPGGAARTRRSGREGPRDHPRR